MVDLEDRKDISPEIQPTGWYKPGGGGDDLEELYNSPSAEYPEGHPSNEPLSDSDLSNAESNPTNPNKDNKSTSAEKDSLGVNDNESDDNSPKFTGKGKRNSRFSLTKKGGLIGGGIAGIIISSVFAFTALLPLKILNVANNLQDRFFSSSNTMFDRYSDRVFGNYIKKHVLSGMGKEGCKSTLTTNASCLSVVQGESKLSRLYRSWSENNLETKLAKDYGLVFEKTGTNGSVKMRVNTNTELDITGFESSNKTLFEFIAEKNPDTTELSRNEIRQLVRKKLSDETGGKKLSMRLKLGKLLERKYGIKRCIVACKSRDDFSDWKNNKTKAYKIALVQRVVEPKSDIISGVMKCVIEGCDPTSNIDRDGVGNGEVERDHNKSLDKLVAKLGTESTEDLFKLYSDVSTKGGVSSYLIEKGLAKYFGAEVAEKVATKAIPVVGWVDLAVKVGKAAQNAPATLRRTGYVATSTAAATYWMMWRTHADEIKLGYVDAEMVGSFTNTLNGLDTDDSGKVFKPDNGGITMESSPLYQQMLGSNSAKTSFLGLPVVNAATAVPCDNNKTIAAGELNCPEERLNQADNIVFNSIDYFFNNTTDGETAKLAIGLWEKTGGAVLNLVGGVFGLLTGAALDVVKETPVIGDAYKEVEEKLASVAQDLFKWVFEAIVPNPFNNIAGNGARSFAMMAAGANHTANTHNQINLGGKKITNEQAFALQLEDQRDRSIAFNNSSLSNRLFNGNDTSSLVSRVAMNLPTSRSISINNLATSIINPFKYVGSTLPFISANADNSNIDTAEVFGEEPIGIPLDDPVYSSDPETYTDEYCKTNGFDEESWAKTAVEDKSTGQFYHTRTNPCILHNTVVESLGAKYDEELLSELGGSSSTSNNTTDSLSDPSVDGSGVGKWSLSPNANRSGASLTPLFIEFLNEMSKYTTFEPIVTTGTNHKMQTSSGNISDHWAGNGADFGQSVNKFGTDNARPGQSVPRGDEIAAAALIACGVPVEEAKNKALLGGNHSAECTVDGQSVRIQMIWKSNVGGNHYNHVHVGIKKL